MTNLSYLKHKLLSSRRWDIKLLTVALLLLGIAVSVQLVRSGVSWLSKAGPDDVRLFFASSEYTLPPDTNLNLMLDAGSKQVGFIRVEVSFDRSKVNLLGEVNTNSSFRRMVIKSTRNEANTNGKVVLALGVDPDDLGQAPSGTFQLAQIPITAVTADPNQSTQLTILRSAIQVVDLGTNSLGFFTEDASIVINPTGSTPTSVIASPTPTAGPTSTPIPTPPPGGSSGIWISKDRLMQLPTSGSAWSNVKSEADKSAGTPELSNQDDRTNVTIMAKALVFARTGQTNYRDDVVSALSYIANSGTYSGRALALGRELAAYVIAADLIDLRNYDPSLDGQFRAKINQLLTTYTDGGPSSLVECHENRPNNWGTHCGGSRAAVAAYLGNTSELARTAQVFKGWLGDRSSYAGFNYGDLGWQCDSSRPVGINPQGCTKQGHNVDGVLPDDQRRGGGFQWPPPKENYVWGGLEGAHMQAVILYNQGYDVWNWENQAMLRAMQWLHTPHFSGGSSYPAEGDDTWQPHLTNYYYGTNFPAPVPSNPGKNTAWTDWTHAR